MQRTFRVNYWQLIPTIFWAFLSVLQIHQILEPGKGGLGLQLFAAAFLIVTAVLAVRTARMGAVVASHDGVKYRSWIRSRVFPWSEIDRFEGRDGRVGKYGWPRRILWVVLRDGAERKLEAMNSAPEKPGKSARLDAVVAELNGLRSR